MYRLADWYFLFLIPLWAFLIFLRPSGKFLPFSSVALLGKSGYKKTRKHLVEKILTFLALCLFSVALSRPQMLNNDSYSSKEGIDILLSLDVSGSMEIADLKPNRLEAAKQVLRDFVKKRTEDRLGLVIFAGTAFTKLPLTHDLSILDRTISDISLTDVKQQGTAIGMGIAVALNRLKKSGERTKIIILATDGDNNEGVISPEVAVNLAKDMKVKLYTIGVGTTKSRIAVKNRLGQLIGYQNIPPIDETLLRSAARETGARYYRAEDEMKLAEIFNDIDQLEKTELKTKAFARYDERYFEWLIAGLFLLALGLLFKEWLFIKIP